MLFNFAFLQYPKRPPKFKFKFGDFFKDETLGFVKSVVVTMYLPLLPPLFLLT